MPRAVAASRANPVELEAARSNGNTARATSVPAVMATTTMANATAIALRNRGFFSDSGGAGVWAASIM